MVERALWAVWWVGCILVALSWFRLVPREVGWAGFLAALGCSVISVVRARYWRPPGHGEADDRPRPAAAAYYMSINRVRQDADPAELARVVGEHGRWVEALIASGQAWWGAKWGSAAGMLIIVARDESEAEAIQRRDPLVLAGLVTFEMARLHRDVEPGSSEPARTRS